MYYLLFFQIISAIDNFLLLFNPNNKFDMCRFWQTLEIKGFDPVIEYNKAIEGFEMRYHPNPEDVFRIIVQISRFLKEFSVKNKYIYIYQLIYILYYYIFSLFLPQIKDFETYFTPTFRHPPITGNIDELNDIGLLRELYS